jgi:quercetin dioxygenase-like cupin family protein
MRTAGFGFVALFVVTSCTPSAVARDDGTAGDQPIPIRAADLAWADLDPVGAPGVRLATLWGDPATGPFGAFFELPAGFAAPLHSHTHPMKVVIVSGTYIQQPHGGETFRLAPGSYLMQPGGDYRHTTSCDTDAACVFFVESDGPFDMFVAEDTADGR